MRSIICDSLLHPCHRDLLKSHGEVLSSRERKISYIMNNSRQVFQEVRREVKKVTGT